MPFPLAATAAPSRLLTMILYWAQVLLRRIKHTPLRFWLKLLGSGTMLAAGFAIIDQHISYLNDLDGREWGHRYLYVNRGNFTFVAKLQRLKLAILLGWMVVFGLCLRRADRVLRQKGRARDTQALQRLGIALPIFLVSLVNYNPPDIELSVYFFVNSVAFALLAGGIYWMPGISGLLTLLGRQVLRLKDIQSRWLIGGAAFIVAVAGFNLGGPFFGHMPLTVDTDAELMHAKMLLNGDWFIPSHPLPRAFDMWMTINDGRWMSQYPPGHLVMLMLGAIFERRTYVLPFLGAATCVAVYYFALAVYGRRVARIAVVLSGACVYLIVMSSEFMMNGTSLLSGTLFLAAYFRMLTHPRMLTGVLGGAAIGYCFITRPYSAVALAVPFMMHALYLLVSEREKYMKPLLAMAAGGGLFLIIQFIWNAGTTGDPFVFGYQRAWGNWHNPLTGEAAAKLSDSEIEKNFRENLQRLSWFNRVIFEWPVPGLVLLALLYGWRGARVPEKLMYLTILSFAISCQVLPGNVEREWGPRLMYESLTIMIVLSAKALAMLPAFLRRVLVRRMSLATIYGMMVLLMVPMYHFTFAHNVKIDTMMRLYNFYGRGGNPAFYKYVLSHVQTPAVVFVRGLAYQAVSFANPPNDDDRIIFVNELDSYNLRVIDHYADRYPYRAYIGRKGFVVEPYR